jgi:hypothetical protein
VLAQQIVRDAKGDRCRARREIAALSARARALVAGGSVPLRLRAPLLAGVAAVVADAPACTPIAPRPAAVSTPAASPAPKPAAAGPKKGHDHGKHKGEEHGHGHGRKGD